VLFDSNTTVAAPPKYFAFRFKSPKHWVEVFRNYYSPVVKALATTNPKAQPPEADLLALFDKFDGAGDGTLMFPSENLEVIITKRG
jgi:hypothetical protein